MSRYMYLIGKLSIVIFSICLLFACSSDDSTSDVVPDGDDDQDKGTPCTIDPDCPTGQLCGPDGYCAVADDGDVSTDGDDEPQEITRIFRMVPEEVLNFGDVEAHTSPVAEVTIYNDGNTVLHLFDANWLEPQIDNPFTLIDYSEYSIQPGQSFTFSIRFEARELGEAQGLLRINNDSDSEATQKAELRILANSIPEAGVAEIGSDPSAEDGVVFEDTALGTRLARAYLRVGNLGPPASEVILTGVYMKSQGLTPFDVEYRQAEVVQPISPDEHVTISGGQSIALTIFFGPDASGEYEDEVVCEYHTNTDEQMDYYEVPVHGEAVAGPLVLIPSALEFDTVTTGEEASIDLTLVNNTDSDTITIRPMRITGVSNWMQVYSFSEGATGTITLGPRENLSFQAIFRPLESIDYSGELQVETDYSGMKFFFPITARGGDANQPPVARISQTSHGSDINAPITVNVGDSKEFFGDISYDPDGDSGNMTYQWYLETPSSSTASPIPHDRATNIAVHFDVADNYLLTLVVTDEMGRESNPKNVRISAVSGSSILRIEMQASGISGNSDIDLSWILPNGTACNEDHTSASGTCLVPSGMGSVLVQACGSASQCTVETITHADAPENGNFEIQARFDEDCSDPAPLLPECNFGLSREDVTYGIYIYVDDVLFNQMTDESLDDAGDMKAWTMRRQNGVWQPPVPK